MKKAKKVLATLAIMGMAVTMVPFNALASTGVTTDRLWGNDRFGTAVKIAEQFVTADTAILAPAANANLVDALAAAPLAGKTSPILLTDNNTLTKATKDELIKLGVKKVYVVGAISQAVLEEVDKMDGVEAIQLKGADRIATAAMISAKLTNPAGSFVVGYGALPDALSVASYAAAHNYSIIVTNPDGTLPAKQAETLPSNAYIIGGLQRVANITGVKRLAGEDRFGTNKVVLETLDYTYNKAYVANGEDIHLVDSLVASSLAAKFGAPIVLTNTTTGGNAVAADFGANLATNAVVVALGGDQFVTDTTVAKVSLAVSSVSASNIGAYDNVTVTFNQSIEQIVKEMSTSQLDELYTYLKVQSGITRTVNGKVDITTLAQDKSSIAISGSTVSFNVSPVVKPVLVNQIVKYSVTMGSQPAVSDATGFSVAAIAK